MVPNRRDIWLASFRSARQDNFSFEILRTEKLRPTRALSTKPTQHTFYAIHWLEQGSGTYFIDFQGFKINSSTLYFLMPGQVHAWDIQEPIDGYTIFFTDEFLELAQSNLSHQVKWMESIQQTPMITVPHIKISFFEHLLKQLFSEYETNQTGRVLAIQALFQLLLVEAQRTYQMQQAPKKTPSAAVLLTQDFKHLVNQHFLTMKSVEGYAKALHINTNYLSDTIKQVTGLPPGVHLRQRLTLEAKRLLAHTDQSVQEIAYGLGFEDPAYFGRFFKREANSSPQAFRLAIREKYQKS
jgi:AraC family transcriptional regulator, transcriptional activator of pobA